MSHNLYEVIVTQWLILHIPWCFTGSQDLYYKHAEEATVWSQYSMSQINLLWSERHAVGLWELTGREQGRNTKREGCNYHICHTVTLSLLAKLETTLKCVIWGLYFQKHICPFIWSFIIIHVATTKAGEYLAAHERKFVSLTGRKYPLCILADTLTSFDPFNSSSDDTIIWATASTVKS
jgi:hypothetical protein